MNVHLITVGDEILIGQIVDTNSAWMARELNLIGAQVVGIDSVGDDGEAIEQALDRAFAHAEVALLTGGLGPTRDDMTKKALADYFGTELMLHEPTWERIQRIFERLGRRVTEAHRQQSFLPATAQLLPNKMGTAPGMWLEREGRVAVSMPGIPYEMQYLMENEVLPRLRKRFPARPIAHRTLLTVGEGESQIAERLQLFEDSLPGGMKLAYLPNLGQVRLRLSGRHEDAAALDALLDEKAAELRHLLPDLVFGQETQTLEEVVGQMLRERNLRLGTAESCTGGHLAHRITAIPGSSDYFEGSVVAYSNAVKQRLLGVKSATLEAKGAVSEAVVIEMVEGALQALDCDLAIATSGIAGPGGGTAEKPVGTVWMAVGNRQHIQPYLLRAGKDRLKNIEFSTVHALNLLRKFLGERYPLEKNVVESGSQL